MTSFNKVNSSEYFLLDKPKTAYLPIIISSPHSGTHYDKKFLDLTGNREPLYKQLEDMYVNELIKGFNNYGSTLLLSKISRAVIDLNRDKKEIDSNLIKDLPNGEFLNTNYVKSGIGLFPRFSADRQKLYLKDFSWSEAKLRIKKYYTPWHSQISSLINELSSAFNFCLLLDYHSMPSDSQSILEKRNQIIIGNDYGKSCDPEITNFIKDLFLSKGYSVGINKPFAGGYITKNYYNLVNNINTLQIEISRDLYMNEKNFERNSDFWNLKNNLNLINKDISEFIKGRCNKKIAAE